MNKIFRRIGSNSGLAQIPLVIGLLIMAVAIPVATKLSQTEQDTRDKAAAKVCTVGNLGTRCTNSSGQSCQEYRLANCDILCNQNCTGGGGGSTPKLPKPTSGGGGGSTCEAGRENVGCGKTGRVSGDCRQAVTFNCSSNQMGVLEISRDCTCRATCVNSSSCAEPTSPPRATNTPEPSCQAGRQEFLGECGKKGRVSTIRFGSRSYECAQPVDFNCQSGQIGVIEMAGPNCVCSARCLNESTCAAATPTTRPTSRPTSTSTPRPTTACVRNGLTTGSTSNCCSKSSVTYAGTGGSLVTCCAANGTVAENKAECCSGNGTVITGGRDQGAYTCGAAPTSTPRPTATPTASNLGSCAATSSHPVMANGETYCQSPYLLGSRAWACNNGTATVRTNYLNTRNCDGNVPTGLPVGNCAATGNHPEMTNGGSYCQTPYLAGSRRWTCNNGDATISRNFLATRNCEETVPTGAGGSCTATTNTPALANGESYCQSPYLAGSRRWTCNNGVVSVSHDFLLTRNCSGTVPTGLPAGNCAASPNHPAMTNGQSYCQSPYLLGSRVWTCSNGDAVITNNYEATRNCNGTIPTGLPAGNCPATSSHPVMANGETYCQSPYLLGSRAWACNNGTATVRTNYLNTRNCDGNVPTGLPVGNCAATGNHPEMTNGGSYCQTPYLAGSRRWTCNNGDATISRNFLATRNCEETVPTGAGGSCTATTNTPALANGESYCQSPYRLGSRRWHCDNGVVSVESIYLLTRDCRGTVPTGTTPGNCAATDETPVLTNGQSYCQSPYRLGSRRWVCNNGVVSVTNNYLTTANCASSSLTPIPGCVIVNPLGGCLLTQTAIDNLNECSAISSLPISSSLRASVCSAVGLRAVLPLHCQWSNGSCVPRYNVNPFTCKVGGVAGVCTTRSNCSGTFDQTQVVDCGGALGPLYTVLGVGCCVTGGTGGIVTPIPGCIVANPAGGCWLTQADLNNLNECSAINSIPYIGASLKSSICSAVGLRPVLPLHCQWSNGSCVPRYNVNPFTCKVGGVAGVCTTRSNCSGTFDQTQVVDCGGALGPLYTVLGVGCCVTGGASPTPTATPTVTVTGICGSVCGRVPLLVRSACVAACTNIVNNGCAAGRNTFIDGCMTTCNRSSVLRLAGVCSNICRLAADEICTDIPGTDCPNPGTTTCEDGRVRACKGDGAWGEWITCLSGQCNTDGTECKFPPISPLPTKGVRGTPTGTRCQDGVRELRCGIQGRVTGTEFGCERPVDFNCAANQMGTIRVSPDCRCQPVCMNSSACSLIPTGQPTGTRCQDGVRELRCGIQGRVTGTEFGCERPVDFNCAANQMGTIRVSPDCRCQPVCMNSSACSLEPTPTTGRGITPVVTREPTTPPGPGSCDQKCPTSDGKILKNCTPPDSDGSSQDSNCDRRGRVEPCGGSQYCCDGSKWSTDMAACGNVPTTPPGCDQKCPTSDGKILKNCTPPDSDGTSQDSNCDRRGRVESCGGSQYCCDGSKWSTDMAACGSGKCKRCPADFKCYTDGSEYRWFVTGYAMEGFELVASPDTTSCGGVTQPSYMGKQKGDANCDGFVDGYDYSIWRTEYVDVSGGEPLVRDNWEADFTGNDGLCDGVVDGYDYSLWRNQYKDLNGGGN